MRRVGGLSGVVLVVGLNCVGAGLVFALGYDSLHTPSAHYPRFGQGTYPIPKWLLNIGLVMIVVGVVLVAAGWLTSPRWHAGMPPPEQRYVMPVLASFVAVALSAFATVLIAGHKSPLVADTMITAVLCLLVVSGLVLKNRRDGRV